MRETERIVTVVDSLGPGGAEQALLTLLPAFCQRGHDCLLVALGPPYDLAPAFERRGVGTRVLGLGSRATFPMVAGALARVIRGFEATVVHAHLFFAGLGVAVTRPFDPAPIRVTTFHNLGYASYPVSSPRRRLRRVVDHLAMQRGMDSCIAVSTAARNHYCNALNLTSVAVIPNAVNVDGGDPETRLDRASVRNRLGVRGADALLLCAGRFRHEKGHRYLVGALSALKDRGVTPVLVLAGDGPLREGVSADVIRRGLDGQVRFVGHLAHAELMGMMTAADVLVVPSTHEGFSITAAEALMLGRPVIASRVGGLPELIQDGRDGVLVPSSNVRALSAAIERVVGDKCLREHLGSHGSATAHRLCDVDGVVDAHEQFYRATRQHKP